MSELLTKNDLQVLGMKQWREYFQIADDQYSGNGENTLFCHFKVWFHTYFDSLDEELLKEVRPKLFRILGNWILFDDFYFMMSYFTYVPLELVQKVLQAYKLNTTDIKWLFKLSRNNQSHSKIYVAIMLASSKTIPTIISTISFSYPESQELYVEISKVILRNKFYQLGKEFNKVLFQYLIETEVVEEELTCVETAR